MALAEFADLHLPALSREEARHNLIVVLLEHALTDPQSALRFWSLGPPGACAIHIPGRSIVLGEVDEAQSHALATQLQDDDYPGVIGPDETASWFVARATALGAAFEAPRGMRISAIRDKPVYPGVPGAARAVTAGDADLFADWLMEFWREATPHAPEPSPDALRQSAGRNGYIVWTVANEPVALAGIIRRSRGAAAIGGVYTPPRFRNRGYAGSATATLVDMAFAEGRPVVTLFIDRANPASNRCYEKIGFRAVCDSNEYRRIPPAG